MVGEIWFDTLGADVASRAWPMPDAPRSRRTPWAFDYLMGWISPQWPKADPRVCHALENELGLEHWFSEPQRACECRGVHTCAGQGAKYHISTGEWARSQRKIYHNRCVDCGDTWDSFDADYLCAACHEKEVTALSTVDVPHYSMYGL